MSVDEAVSVLNYHKHNFDITGEGASRILTWKIGHPAGAFLERKYILSGRVVKKQFLSTFELLAIAEKYMREY